MVSDMSFKRMDVGRKEMFYLTMYSTHFIYGYMVLDISFKRMDVRGKELFYLMTHSTHFIYGYMVLDMGFKRMDVGRKGGHMGISPEATSKPGR